MMERVNLVYHKRKNNMWQAPAKFHTQLKTGNSWQAVAMSEMPFSREAIILPCRSEIPFYREAIILHYTISQCTSNEFEAVILK